VRTRMLSLSVVVLAAAGAWAATASASVPPQVKDYASIARDIVPAGNWGTIPTPATLPKIERQAKMYNALTPLFSHVTRADINSDFKAEPINVSGAPGPITSESVPHQGIRIYRDVYNVPYIYAHTDADLTWAAGWVEAEDQGLLLGEAHSLGLLAAVDAPNLSVVNLIGELASYTPSKQVENEVAKQTGALLAHGSLGRATLRDIDIYLKGMNAYQAAQHAKLRFTRDDIYSLNAIKDQFVGEGGGNQALNSEFLSALERRLGAHRGRRA
jgi:hypothetical protein